jgi:hypothetical protein
MGNGRIFLKSLGDASFNKDLSNESNFDRIHLVGPETLRWTVPLFAFDFYILVPYWMTKMMQRYINKFHIENVIVMRCVNRNEKCIILRCG